MLVKSLSSKICGCSFLFAAAVLFFFSPSNTNISLANELSSNTYDLTTPTTSENSSIKDGNYVYDTNKYWGAVWQQVQGYSEDVYLSEDTARTLYYGTNGDGTNTPTVSGTVRGTNFTKSSKIPSTTFNALYYYLNYKDVREACGANPQTLVDNWVLFGNARTAAGVTQLIVQDGSDGTTYPQYGSSSYEYVVPSNQKTSTKSDGMIVIQGEVHSNGGMNRQQEIAARSVASQIANFVFDQVLKNGSGTQIEMVAYATGIVKAYCDRGTYTTNGTIYRTAYGVFIGDEYSSAGSTRALGLVLDYLDDLCQKWNTANKSDTYGPLKWVHVNANKWDDQWCQIVCDYHEAYADPIAGWAGYGKHPNDGGSAKDVKSYVSYAYESDIISTRSPLVDGQTSISQQASPQKNKNNN